MKNEINNFLKMRDEMTDAQERKVSAEITAVRCAGQNYTLTKDGRDILIEARGQIYRVNPKGKMTWGESPAPAA